VLNVSFDSAPDNCIGKLEGLCLAQPRFDLVLLNLQVRHLCTLVEEETFNTLIIY